MYPFYHLSHISATLTGFMLIRFFFRLLILHTMQQKGSYCVQKQVYQGDKSQVRTSYQVTSKNKSSSHKQKQMIKSQANHTLAQHSPICVAVTYENTKPRQPAECLFSRREASPANVHAPTNAAYLPCTHTAVFSLEIIFPGLYIFICNNRITRE